MLGVDQNSERILDRKSSSATWVLVATILGSSMVFIDGTVVNVALPVMQRDLHASMADIQWVVEAYALFLFFFFFFVGALFYRYCCFFLFTIGLVCFVVSFFSCQNMTATESYILS